MNWTSTELWFYFGFIESPNQTLEATKEQFSVPIRAHSSFWDCCVTVISVLGGRQATAKGLLTNCLPVAAAWFLWRFSSIYWVCVHLWQIHVAFTERFHYTYTWLSPSHFNITNSSKKKQSQNWLALYCSATSPAIVSIDWVCYRHCLDLRENIFTPSVLHQCNRKSSFFAAVRQNSFDYAVIVCGFVFLLN